ncbi:hypothetical protein EYF80_057808 [Liparis tanakae]|uniref:Uncharacterized protein n=1 Tax=Liparis tanakae TaxID=230148 RepID=A0A4Z2ET04_9TELE|nr:hypothetical protein EYF80_057808 [Liparis tanakae]
MKRKGRKKVLWSSDEIRKLSAIDLEVGRQQSVNIAQVLRSGKTGGQTMMSKISLTKDDCSEEAITSAALGLMDEIGMFPK